jgi:hypothetical protein
MQDLNITAITDLESKVVSEVKSSINMTFILGVLDAIKDSKSNSSGTNDEVIYWLEFFSKEIQSS